MLRKSRCYGRVCMRQPDGVVPAGRSVAARGHCIAFRRLIPRVGAGFLPQVAQAG